MGMVAVVVVKVEGRQVIVGVVFLDTAFAKMSTTPRRETRFLKKNEHLASTKRSFFNYTIHFFEKRAFRFDETLIFIAFNARLGKNCDFASTKRTLFQESKLGCASTQLCSLSVLILYTERALPPDWRPLSSV